MKKIIYLIFLFFTPTLFAQLPPESDPHRGMYFDRFVKESMTTNNVIDPSFSILSVDTNSDGIFEKEDAYLNYVCENHITYIALYDMHKIIGGGLMGWNENTKRYENLEVHLCRFMEKAKNQYGVTQIGAVGGSVGLFEDLEDYMNEYPVAPGCTTCQADFDVLTIENEFWGDCTGDLPAFIAIMDAMDNLKQTYNAAHPDNLITTDAYVAFLEHCATSPGLAQTAQVIDGCKNCTPFSGLQNPHPQKIDRVLYTILGKNPYQFSFNEINSFENTQTFDTTDFHPMFYSEGMNTSGTYDFYGPWLASEPRNTIFVAEDYFYYWWRMMSNAAHGQPQMNDVQPGGAHWFAGSHMVGILDDPMVVQVYQPYCTSDSSRVVLNYLGPDESGTDYNFYITRDSDNAVVYPKDGTSFRGVSLSTVNDPGNRTINFSDSTLFPPLYLTPGEYTSHIELAYNHSTGCTYTSEFKFIVAQNARLQIAGDTAFCRGGQTFLTTVTGASQYEWYRNGQLIDGANTNILKVTEGGDYFCELTGGDCPSVTDTVHITVHVLPVSEINAVCNGNGTVTLKTNLLPTNPNSTATTGAGGVTYKWNTGDETDQITVSANASGPYRVIITDPYSGCSLYRDLSIPGTLIANYTAQITVNAQPTGCDNNGSLTAFLTPAPGIYDPIRYLWSTGDRTETITNVPAGTYTVAMTSYNDACSFYKTVTIGSPSGNTPVLNETVTPASCINTQNGSIELNPSGGRPPFTYKWKNIPDEDIYNSTDRDQMNLFPGVYEVLITDSDGCDYGFTFTVGNNTGAIEVSEDNVSPVTDCATFQNGSGTVLTNGGTPPYSQLWIDNHLQTFTNGNTLFAGSYKVIVTDQSGCTGYTYVHIPSENSPMHYDLLDSSLTELSCNGNDGKLFMCIHGGVPPYSLDSAWSINSNIISRYNMIAGSYPLMVTDSLGCVFTDTLEINSAHLLFTGTPFHTTCVGCTNGEINLSVGGGLPPYSVTWTPNVGQLNGLNIEQLPAGLYSVCITDSTLCQFCDTISVLDDPLLTQEISSDGNVIIHPNPTTGSIVINVKDHSSQVLHLELSDMYGKKSSASFIEGEQLNDLQLANGLYFLIVKNENSVLARRKLIVSR